MENSQLNSPAVLRTNFKLQINLFFSVALILLSFISTSLNAQTFNFNSWTAGSFSYSNVQGGNTMSVVYTESANNRAQTLTSTTCFGSPTTTPTVPFFYNSSTMNIADYSSSSCYCSNSPSQSGLVLAGNWPNNNASHYEQIVITFTNPVCSPVNFNIWDINQNFWSGDGSTYFTDKIDISATDASASPVPAANIGISNCGSNGITTAGNTKTITGNVNGCNCGSHSVSITSQVKTITIRYYPGGSTYSTNPWSQYVIISNITATAPPTASITPGALACGSNSTTLTANTNAGSPTYTWTGPGGSTINSPNSSSTVVTGAGTYTLTVNQAGCTSTATYTLTPSGTPPNVSAAANQVVTCSSPTISASSTDPVTFSWTGPGIVSGSGTATPTVNAPGVYTVTVTNTSNGCTNTANVSVTLDNTPPTAVGGSPLALNCTTSSGTISVTTNAGSPSYLWTGPGIVSGSTSATPTVNAGGTYNVTVTNTANGCTNTASVNVTMNNTIPTAVPGSTLALNCTTSSGAISVTTNAGSPTYLWTGPGIVSGSTSASPTVNAAGTYNVTVTNTANGCTNTTSVNVTSNTTPPTAVPGSSLTLNCTTTSGAISVTTNAGSPTYLWTGPGIVSGSTTASPTVNAAGTYNVTVTNTANGCTNTTSVNVSSNTTAPNITMGPNASLTCASPIVTITGSSTTPNAVFAWTDSGGNPAGTTPNASSTDVGVGGTYTLTVTNPVNGCTITGTLTVSANASLPQISLGNSQEITCTTTSVTISGSSTTPNVSYAWTDSGSNPAGSTPGSASTDVTTSGTYTLTVTDLGSGCTSVGNITVTLNNTPPDITLAATASIGCTSNTVTLSGSTSVGNPSYAWTDASSNPAGTTPNASSTEVNATGVYTLTITDGSNGCVNSSTITVTQDAAPTASAGNDVTLTCTSTSVQLDGTGSANGAGITYSWSGPGIVSGGTTTTPTVDQAGTYTLTVTDNNSGCTSTSTVTVTPDTNSPLADAGSVQTINCTTSQVSVDGSGSSGSNLSYSWAGPGIINGATNSIALVNQGGTYYLTVTNTSNGCTSTDSVEVIVDTLAPPADAGTDIIVCEGNIIVLYALPNVQGFAYVWSGPGIVSGGNTADPIVNAAGIYSVIITGTNGCSAQDSVEVVINPAPNASFTATPTSGNAPLNVSTTNTSTGTNLTYAWTFGNGSGSTSINPGTTYTIPGTYDIILVVTDSLGCTDTARSSIEVIEFPIDIPNGFTPNNDGSNDVFEIVGLTQYPLNKITIYNRWGDLVFSAEPYLSDWDGTSNNKKLKLSGDKVVDGTYYFILDLGDGTTPFNGFVELKSR